MAFFGQDPVFYDLMEAQAEAAHKAAQAFHTLTQDFGQAERVAETVKRLETEADSLTHDLVNKTDAKFITPLDKGDMHGLSQALDNITDTLEAAVARIHLYQITQVRPDLAPMTERLVAITQATREGVGYLRHLKDHKTLAPILVRIHDLENENDQLYRAALGTLLNASGADPILVIKWKEVYDRIEIVADECERAADILESLVVKYA
jgi:predicted phosphate transport protein (TIGR00153 family)